SRSRGRFTWPPTRSGAARHWPRRSAPSWKPRSPEGGARAASAGWAPQEGDEPVAKLGWQRHLPEARGSVDRALVRLDEGHARRARGKMPLEPFGLLARKRTVHVVGQQVHAFRAPQIVGLV